MNRNGRRIALSMVAIVLGAGYLMKVIPPETDIGVNDSHSISIDGALVTNPLDITEIPQGFASSLLSISPDSRSEAQETDATSRNTGTPSVSKDLDPAPPFPLVSNGNPNFQASVPNEASEPATDFPSELNVPPSFPPVGEVAVNSSAPGGGGSANPPGGTPPGSPPVQNPGNNPDDGSVVTPPPMGNEGPDSPPNIDLPSDPQSPGPKVPDIDDTKLPDTIPDSWNPEIPIRPDLPNHQVPDSGMVATMLGFSLALLAIVSRRLDRKTR